MYGIDLFFRSAAAGMKIAQKSVENMFRIMALFLQKQSRTESDMKAPSKKTDEENDRMVPASKPDPALSTSSSPVAKESVDTLKTKELTPPETAPITESAKQTLSKRYVGAKSEAVRAKAAESAKKAPYAKEIGVPKQKTPFTKEKAAPPKKSSASDKEIVAAIDAVRRVLSEKKTPMKTEEIMRATGFTKKKVQDNLYRLKKRGEIKMVEKGVYVKN